MRKSLLKIDSLRTRQNDYSHILAGLSFLVLTLLTVKTLGLDIYPEATELRHAIRSGSMSVSNAAMINVIPASKQASAQVSQMSLSWGEKTDQAEDSSTHSGYTYSGWQNGSSNFTVEGDSANLNMDHAKTVTVTMF